MTSGGSHPSGAAGTVAPLLVAAPVPVEAAAPPPRVHSGSSLLPLAGQGVNLGYRDVDALLDILSEAKSQGEAWASLPVLKRYQARRRADNFIMQSGMDLFYAGFTNDLAPVRVLRNIGLMAAAHAGVLKRQALKYALGL